MTCAICGCTEDRPCLDENGDTCYWIISDNQPVCSFCAADPRRRVGVELYSEAEADAFLREWRSEL